MTHPELEHFTALMVLVARLGDIGSTYLASPNLELEGNPVVRRLRWPFALASLLLALVPYWSVGLGLVVLVPSLLVTAANSAKLWVMRSCGEEAYHRFLVTLAGRARPLPALLSLLAPPLFVGLLGVTLLVFYPTPQHGYGYYFGNGVLVYAFALGVFGPSSFLRLRKAARASG